MVERLIANEGSHPRDVEVLAAMRRIKASAERDAKIAAENRNAVLVRLPAAGGQH
jgi:hypothetical protein